MSFDDFWATYPRKVAKKDAEKMWRRLNAAQQQKAVDCLPTHIRIWNAEGRDKSVIPHAATWLNGERFEDELEMPKPKAALYAIPPGSINDAKPGESMEAYLMRKRLSQ